MKVNIALPRGHCAGFITLLLKRDYLGSVRFFIILCLVTPPKDLTLSKHTDGEWQIIQDRWTNHDRITAGLER